MRPYTRIDILKIAGCILAAGAILTPFLIRNKDMVHTQQDK
jgi:hypothetical protein